MSETTEKIGQPVPCAWCRKAPHRPAPYTWCENSECVAHAVPSEIYTVPEWNMRQNKLLDRRREDFSAGRAVGDHPAHGKRYEDFEDYLARTKDHLPGVGKKERMSNCCSAGLIQDERSDEVAMCSKCKEWCGVVAPEDGAE